MGVDPTTGFPSMIRTQPTEQDLPVDGVVHASDCATNNLPVMETGPCDCGKEKKTCSE